MWNAIPDDEDENEWKLTNFTYQRQSEHPLFVIDVWRSSSKIPGWEHFHLIEKVPAIKQ